MHVLQAAVEAIQSGRPAALVWVLEVGGSTPRSPGSRMLVYADGSSLGTIGGGAVEHQVIAAAVEVIRAGVPRRYEAHLTRDLGMCCGGEMAFFIEPLETREPLAIYGAGHVAHALAPMAVALGFQVTVVDERDELNNAERFPDCSRVATDPVLHAEELERGYALVVTHDHALDQDLVNALLPNDALTWVGMIGSKVKVTRFLIRLRAAGMDDALLQRLCAPVGLDIGAETPTEIAVAIAGELVRVRRHADRSPAPLSSVEIPARNGTARPTGWR